MILVGYRRLVLQFCKKKYKMKKSILLLVLLGLFACKQEENQAPNPNPHWEPTHNFSVIRLLILNDQNEVLMGKVESNWYPPSLVFSQRQFLGESLDSLSATYGITTTSPQLRAYFSFKYEYHPYATLRPYYVAHYKDGEINTPEDVEEVQWMPVEQVIKKTPVEAMKEITHQLTTFPDTVWGGSFMVYRKGEEHHTRVVEPFYSLFSCTP